MAKILVTGGAGFIGSNFIRYWLDRHPEDFITNLDSLTYAGNSKTVAEFNGNSRVRFVQGDVCDASTVDSLMGGHEAVFHFAAETHVDRSLMDSQVFLKTNFLGTHVLLESAKKYKVKRFMFISTDEVYGSIKKGRFKEASPLAPNSPYSVSKASADLLCRSYWVSFETPVIITRCCNNFGPHQFPEKVIPLFITNLLEGKKIPVYGKGLNIREWIYVLDFCRAIDVIYRKGKLGEAYNVGSGNEMKNIELSKRILKMTGRDRGMIQFVQDRPGHDFRYALDCSKLKKLGWKPERSFDQALRETIDWYIQNPAWWTEIKSKSSYQGYVQKQYASATTG